MKSKASFRSSPNAPGAIDTTPWAGASREMGTLRFLRLKATREIIIQAGISGKLGIRTIQTARLGLDDSLTDGKTR